MPRSDGCWWVRRPRGSSGRRRPRWRPAAGRRIDPRGAVWRRCWVTRCGVPRGVACRAAWRAARRGAGDAVRTRREARRSGVAPPGARWAMRQARRAEMVQSCTISEPGDRRRPNARRGPPAERASRAAGRTRGAGRTGGAGRTRVAGRLARPARLRRALEPVEPLRFLALPRSARGGLPRPALTEGASARCATRSGTGGCRGTRSQNGRPHTNGRPYTPTLFARLSNRGWPCSGTSCGSTFRNAIEWACSWYARSSQSMARSCSPRAM